MAKLNNLRRLTAVGALVTDSGVAYLKDMKRLMYLNLSGTKITDAALCHLSHLDRLETLDFAQTNVSDAGLLNLAGLKRLRVLDLSSTNVTDESTKTLKQLKDLDALILQGTKITPVGFWELRQAMPKCFAGERYGHYWGKLEKPHGSLGPQQLSQKTGEREKTLVRLLLLGCDLRANNKDEVIEVIVPAATVRSGDSPFHPKEQVHEAIRLIGTMGTVANLSIGSYYTEPQGILDDETTRLLRGLRGLRELDVSRCWFGETGWLNLAQLPQLRRLNLVGAKISGEIVRKLHKALPHCEIVGRPSSDEKFPPPDAVADVVMAELRRGFPGKSDLEIITILHSYLPIDEPTAEAPGDWFAHRLEAAKKQSAAVRAIEQAQVGVRYQDEFFQVGDRVVRQNLSRPEWLREALGDDFFRPVVVIEGGATYASAEFVPPGHFQWLKFLPDLPQLRGLQINNAPDEELKHLKGLNELRTLMLDHGQFTGDGLKCLGELPRLIKLDLFCCEQFCDSGMKNLEQSRQLRNLWIHGSPITDTGLKHLSGLAHLEELDLGNTAITGSGLENLQMLPKLHVLRICKSGIEPWIGKLADAAMPPIGKLVHLEELDLTWNDITDTGLASLGKLSRLKSLTLASNQRITDSGLKHIVQLAGLRTLDLQGTATTNDGLQQLLRLDKIESLSLGFTRVTGEGLARLKQFPHLEWIVLSGDQAFGVGLEHLKALPKLKKLTVWNTPVGGRKILRQALPNCEILGFPYGRGEED